MKNVQKKNLIKNLNKYSTKFDIYQTKLNDFKEIEGEELIKTINGLVRFVYQMS